MPKRPAFPRLRDATKKQVARRELFLAEMGAVVLWTRLLALIAPLTRRLRRRAAVRRFG